MYCDEICDKELHLGCSFYQQAKKSYFEILSFNSGEKIRRVKSDGQMVFVISGEIEFSYAANPNHTATDGMFFFVPRKIGVNIHFRRQTRLIFFTMKLDIDFCASIRERIFNINTRYSKPGIVILSANRMLLHHIEIIRLAFDSGLFCSKYMHAQIGAFLTVVCAFYPTETVLHFFSPLVSHSFREVDNDKFYSTVMQAQNTVFSVQEFADLTNLNPVSFRRQFKQIFKVTPQQWITENRKRLIYEELIINTHTIYDIANMFGFSEPGELYRFCKMHYGQTAKEIRNRNQT